MSPLGSLTAWLRVADITRLYVAKTFSRDDIAVVKSAMQVAALPDSCRSHFQDRLATA